MVLFEHEKRLVENKEHASQWLKEEVKKSTEWFSRKIRGSDDRTSRAQE